MSHDVTCLSRVRLQGLAFMPTVGKPPTARYKEQVPRTRCPGVLSWTRSARPGFYNVAIGSRARGCIIVSRLGGSFRRDLVHVVARFDEGRALTLSDTEESSFSVAGRSAPPSFRGSVSLGDQRSILVLLGHLIMSIAAEWLNNASGEDEDSESTSEQAQASQADAQPDEADERRQISQAKNKVKRFIKKIRKLPALLEQASRELDELEKRSPSAKKVE